jgi:hypothetical protein
VLETKLVIRVDPFQLTTAVAANPVPFTVSVNPWLPGLTVIGIKG